MDKNSACILVVPYFAHFVQKGVGLKFHLIIMDGTLVMDFHWAFHMALLAIYANKDTCWV